jgi:NAD(P) transhydrogenase subunit alpha
VTETRPTTVGVVAESDPDERRVALVPKAVSALAGDGVAVIVESGAGLRALLPDELYTAAGATIGDPWGADIVVKVAPPSAAEVARLRSGQTLVGFLAPRNADNQIAALRSAGVQAFAVEAIPRISRAQAMDALSSQANVAGYKAVVLAASESTRFFPMLTTAAGTVRPAKVLVIGAGVAGLQAIATARRLGAQVEGFDVRPETREQIQSLGARFLDLGVSAAGEGGYARALTEEERAEQQRRLADHLRSVDVVICTAAVPGRPAPTIVTAAMVEGMAAGSVIVDLAAESGGNCALTQPGQCIEHQGVTIDGPLGLASRGATQASEMYARNLLNFVALFVREGQLSFDWEDELLAKTRWQA